MGDLEDCHYQASLHPNPNLPFTPTSRPNAPNPRHYQPLPPHQLSLSNMQSPPPTTTDLYPLNCALYPNSFKCMVHCPTVKIVSGRFQPVTLNLEYKQLSSSFLVVAFSHRAAWNQSAFTALSFHISHLHNANLSFHMVQRILTYSQPYRLYTTLYISDTLRYVEFSCPNRLS